MRYYHYFRFNCLLFFLLFLFRSTFLFGADLTLDASVDRNKLTLAERLTYSITIRGKDLNELPEVQLPDLVGKFDVLSSSESTSFQWINGNMSSQKTRQYVLVPISPGQFKIGEATLTVGGKKITTQAFNVLVLPNQTKNQSSASAVASKPSQGDINPTGPDIDRYGNVMLNAWVSHTDIYQGQQLKYGLDFYKRIQLWSNLSMEQPSFKGFWASDLNFSKKEEIRLIRNMRFLEFKLLRKSLFPLQPGQFTIDPAKVGFTVSPFEGQRVLASQPITINVLPLPAVNVPESFSGVVGEFSMNASLNVAEAKQNTPVSLKIQINGQGNLKGIKELNYFKHPDFRIYLANLQDTIRNDQLIEGTLLFEYIVIPKVSGSLQIPEFVFSYFSPIDSAYKTLTVGPFALMSIRKDGAEVSGVGGDESTGPASIEVLREDIHYLATSIELVPFQYLTDRMWFRLLAAINGMVFLFWLWMMLGPYIFKKDALKKKQNQAYDRASRALADLKKSAQIDQSYLTAYQNILYDFIGDKLGRSVIGLTKDNLQREIEVFKHPAAEDKILKVVDLFAMAIFAPNAMTAADIQRADEMVTYIFLELKGFKS